MKPNIFVYLNTFLLTVLASFCHYLTKPNFEKREANLYRCGRFQNRLFVREIQTEEYPDLGILLAYADSLGLSEKEKKAVEEKAQKCYAVCEVLLQELYRIQDDLKDKIMQANQKNILPTISGKLNELAIKKKQWLSFHTKCYYEGLKLVNPRSLSEWQWIEDDFRPLPTFP